MLPRTTWALGSPAGIEPGPIPELICHMPREGAFTDQPRTVSLIYTWIWGWGQPAHTRSINHMAKELFLLRKAWVALPEEGKDRRQASAMRRSTLQPLLPSGWKLPLTEQDTVLYSILQRGQGRSSPAVSTLACDGPSQTVLVRDPQAQRCFLFQDVAAVI